MNTRFLLLGAAAIALGVAAGPVYADPPGPGAPHAEHRGPPPPMMDIDANHDGFVSRAEAQTAAEKMFDAMDDNHDGKLDASDHDGRMERRIVIRREMRDGPPPPGAEGGRVDEDTVIEHGDTTERRVVIRREERGPHDVPPEGPGDHGGPHMHGPPMMGMMLLMHSGEADVNGDGALSKQEFVNQQLRFFDAADVNGDGKIKFDPPPMPPMPPMPPEPPQPPSAGDAPQPPTPPTPPRR